MSGQGDLKLKLSWEEGRAKGSGKKTWAKSCAY
jgi:hypothetical protein